MLNKLIQFSSFTDNAFSDFVNLESSVLREGLHGLPNSQVQHDLFRATIDGRKFEALLKTRDVLTHSRLRDPTTAKDLYGQVSNRCTGTSGTVFEQSSLSSKMMILSTWSVLIFVS